MSSSAKSNRVRKPKAMKDEHSGLDTVMAQVHKPTVRDISSDRETQRTTTEGSETSSCSNKTFILEEKNDNYSITQTPSVDEDTQINSKIINLIESEIKREGKKNNTVNIRSHFTDSRPQSLSFYEEEKLPEELSGNLELLSPEERKHYKRRKEHLTMATMMDTDERNIYNISDAYNKESDDLATLKKAKSRKKKHGESELGDSREMMIPKERKSKPKKKKHHEASPILNSDAKRKHRKQREEHHNHHLEPRTDVTIALEDLQDDVFESTMANSGGPGIGIIDQDQRYQDISKSKRSPRRADKVYVQKKHKFEMIRSYTECPVCKGSIKIKGTFEPLNFAIAVQAFWRNFARLCHGLLAGLALAHILYVDMVFRYENDPDSDDYQYSAKFVSAYTWLFYFLCTVCIVSVFDQYDFARLSGPHCSDLIYQRKTSILMLIYIIALLVHLMNVRMDELIGREKIFTTSEKPLKLNESISLNITNSTRMILKDFDDEKTWHTLSLIRGVSVTVAWFVLTFAEDDCLLTLHLKNMLKYQT